ncbi:MAG TPA: DEAD/DEAH box helicase, partial [Clostridiales bacterium]|nr:DEAD/DEAH box helicase [Clostridiales bacterium]
ENYLNYFYKKPDSFIDFLESDALIFIDDPSRVQEKANAAFYEFRENFSDLLEKGEVLPRQGDLMNNYKQLLFQLQSKQAFLLSNLPKNYPDFSIAATVKFASRMVQNFHGKIDLLTEELKQYKKRGYRTILLCGTEQRALHLENELKQRGVECVYLPQKDRGIQKGQIVVLEGYLRKGFEYLDSRMLLMTEDEIFGTVKKKRKIAKRKDARPIKSFTDLELGDYIVHENHGIGKYIGIEQLNVQGAKKDYLKIKYAGKDLLYVPIEQMDLVQKYIGSDQGPPKLSKLGGTEWKKAKARAKGAIADMAEELLKLNAMRQMTQGYAFSPDTVWQKQFEDLFPYEETPDQLRCIEEVKRDMEKTVPMDRLLCGDVGYGKTEVAIRAIFKCVMDGKQAAFLVPTTILAQQHYNTFVERFQPFPVTIEMLSRFRTEKQQKEIIKKIREGNIDIIIGTHRILSKDIQFKDLGLLIIDEEQRFGVQHKEALKQLKQNVDVLTLTATPIPRTLHMSLIGLRDMSLIEDPPEERYPVQTYVIEYNEEIV